MKRKFKDPIIVDPAIRAQEDALLKESFFLQVERAYRQDQRKTLDEMDVDRRLSELHKEQERC